MAKKTFPIENVLTVYTGVCMKAGVGMAHDVFDHLYPGIFTLGCAAMQPRAAKELQRQHPQLAEIAPIDDGKERDYERFLVDALTVFGDALTVDGPVASAPPTGLGMELSEIAKRHGGLDDVIIVDGTKEPDPNT